MFTPDDIKKYMFQVDVTKDWVSYRDPVHPANSWPPGYLGIDGRYNLPGQPVYYLASGVDTARAEVPNYGSRPLHYVNAGAIDAFDLRQWSIDNGKEKEFLRSKEDGGYGICQDAAMELTKNYGVSGILALSAGRNSQTQTGLCLIWHTITGVAPDVFGPPVSGCR